MGKSPGFWFFTGDWMKDSELRFCSIFARGLLVDLLCLMFEAKQMGYMSKPDGSPRSDEDIVNAVSGATTAEKLSGLRELEQSGVLSRDSNGVLFSRRLARLAEISKERSKAGSKGGSKTKAKPKQNDKQNDKQKRGVTDSDSVSDSDTNNINIQKAISPLLLDSEFMELFEAFKQSSRVNHNWTISEVTAEAWLYDLQNLGLVDAKLALRFSTSAGTKKPLTNGDHKKKPEQPRGHRYGKQPIDLDTFVIKD